MAAHPVGPGDQLGNYDLLEKLGEGGVGAVFKARNRVTQANVAIKIMHADVASHPVQLKRFEQEFRVASQLDHPNVIRVLEFAGSGPSPYLVMELVDGESLGDRLEREHRIPEAEAIRIIVQVAQGLLRAHQQGLIHRDVKPDNVLLTADGKAKLTDLGLVKDPDASDGLTRPGGGLGTPPYMAPEQFRNAKHASVRCDIYSLGATLYHMVTGTIPFGGEAPMKALMLKMKSDFPPPRKVVPELSERIDWAICKAMSADPEQRPGTCREFVGSLIGSQTQQGGEAKPLLAPDSVDGLTLPNKVPSKNSLPVAPPASPLPASAAVGALLPDSDVAAGGIVIAWWQALLLLILTASLTVVACWLFIRAR